MSINFDDFFFGATSEDGDDDRSSMVGEWCCHIAIVSISESDCQCVDCLRVWPKGPDFKSDWPNMDRG